MNISTSETTGFTVEELSGVSYYVIESIRSEAMLTDLINYKFFTKEQIKVIILSGEYVTEKTSLIDYDDSGRPVVSLVTVPKGWTFNAGSFNFKTSIQNSQKYVDKFGNSLPTILELSFYDSQSGYSTFQQCAPESAIITIATLTHLHDFYIVGGEARQIITPTVDVTLHATLAPFVPYAEGGARVFIQNKNLRFCDNKIIEADGRTPKFVPHIQVSAAPVLYSNSIEVAVNHPVGFAHELEIEIRLFKL